jgi:hypothetical protein
VDTVNYIMVALCITPPVYTVNSIMVTLRLLLIISVLSEDKYVPSSSFLGFQLVSQR